jgi:putative ABC transport system substrate-binding protein
MFNPDTAPVSVYMPSFETAARSLNVVPIAAPVHDDVEIETAIIGLGREPLGGLIAMPDTFTVAHRVPIISAAARNNVPAVYPRSDYARDGGLLSYGIDLKTGWKRRSGAIWRKPGTARASAGSGGVSNDCTNLCGRTMATRFDG